MQAQRRSRSARTTGLVDGERVVGFYSLATHAVANDSAPLKLVKGVLRYDAVPAVRLARLGSREGLSRPGAGRTAPGHRGA